MERRAAGATAREGRSLSAGPPLPKPLAALAELRELSAEEVRRRFDVRPEGTEERVQYRHEDGVTALHNRERLPGTHFFFRDGALVAIYIAAGLVLDGLRPAELTAELGEPAAVLPSRTWIDCGWTPARGRSASSRGERRMGVLIAAGRCGGAERSARAVALRGGVCVVGCRRCGARGCPRGRASWVRVA